MMVFYLCLPQRLFPEVRLFTASLANFFFAHFHAASTEATKAETLLCLTFDPTPQTVCGDPSRGRSNTHPSPFLCSQIFLSAAALRFPHELRELDQWDVFGLFPRLASMWIYLSKSWMQYFFLFNRLWWESNPSSRAPCSEVPLTVLSQFPQVTLLGLFSVKVQAGCWQVHQQMSRSALTPALCAAQPAIEPMGSLRKGFDRYLKWKYFDWEFYWSHAIKLYRGLNLIALSALGQYTWINYSWNTKLMLRYDTKEWTLLHLL